MSALTATLFIRRCVGGTSSAFIGSNLKHVIHRDVKPKGAHPHPQLFVTSVKPMKASTTMEMSTISQPDISSLIGIDWVRSSIVSTLNQIFDPVELAKGSAVAKLDSKKKKKKKIDDEKEPNMSSQEREAIIDAAAKAAKPFCIEDAMVTPATKPEFGDYQCNAAMSLAKSAGLNPRDCAAKIVQGLMSIDGFSDIMEEPDIAGPGFINLKFKEDYLVDAARKMAVDSKEGGRLAVPMTA